MDARQCQGEPRLLISRSALLHNAGVIRRSLAEGTRICAILKADAYGHGASIVAQTLCNVPSSTGKPAVEALAVASIGEALALPAGLKAKIIIFRPIENGYVGLQRVMIEHAIRNGWVLTVCSTAGAQDIARIALAMPARAQIQVMIDTGMTRGGIEPQNLHELLYHIGQLPSLQLVAICTHFASAEERKNGFTLDQLARFRQCIDRYSELFIGKVLRHAANSAAAFFLPAAHLDMVRPGIALYGIDPTLQPNSSRSLRPVMKWTAPLVDVRTIRRGVCVGYNHTWRAQRDTKIGLVPVGYADGYPRVYSDRACMLVHGRQAPIAGRVSMDLTTIDLGESSNARIGDEVTLLDNDPLSPVSAYNLAQWADTIPYEVFCRIGPRVRRVPVAPEGWGDSAATHEEEMREEREE
jgi:alanine racemase